jgi:hypothetical protein
VQEPGRPAELFYCLIRPTGKIIAARSRSRGLAEQKPVAPEFIEPDQAEGRFAIVTNVGMGCGGRGSLGCDEIAGRLRP